MKLSIFVLLLLATLNAGAQSEAGASDAFKVDVYQVCQHFEDFKKLNIVLCAAAEQLRATSAPLKIDKELACIYPSLRDDERVCPANELEKMELPEVPFLKGELPVWPVGQEPVLLKVNGKALNTTLPMHSSFFNDEFDLATSCNSQDGDLRKTDRILCAPFVADLALADAGRYDGDPRDLIIARLKKQIQKIEAELAKPEPVVEQTTEVNDRRTKDDVSTVPPESKPKQLKVYGLE